jgi:hypothetical protein
VHIPIFVIKLISTDTLDIMTDDATCRLQNCDPRADLLRYISLMKVSAILIDEFEQRLRLLYGVDVGQVTSGSYKD